MIGPWKEAGKRSDIQRTIYLPTPRDIQFAFKMHTLWSPLWLTAQLTVMGMLGGRNSAWQQVSSRQQKMEFRAVASVLDSISPFTHHLLFPHSPVWTA